jgi:hypothetical protein
MLSPRKPDGPVWYSGLSDFPVLKPSYPIGSQCVHNSRLLHSSLHGQNPK